MCLMESCGHMDSRQLLDENQTVDVKQRFFFMRDVAKSKRFIIDDDL